MSHCSRSRRCRFTVLDFKSWAYSRIDGHFQQHLHCACAETVMYKVCLQPVLEHRQRRGRRNIAWQAIAHLCSSNRKGTASDSWPTTGRNVKLFSGGGPEPASVRHVDDTWRRQVRWCGTSLASLRGRLIDVRAEWSSIPESNKDWLQMCSNMIINFNYTIISD